MSDATNDELIQALKIAFCYMPKARRLGSNAQHHTIKQSPTLGISAQPTKR